MLQKTIPLRGDHRALLRLHGQDPQACHISLDPPLASGCLFLAGEAGQVQPIPLAPDGSASLALDFIPLGALVYDGTAFPLSGGFAGRQALLEQVQVAIRLQGLPQPIAPPCVPAQQPDPTPSLDAGPLPQEPASASASAQPAPPDAAAGPAPEPAAPCPAEEAPASPPIRPPADAPEAPLSSAAQADAPPDQAASPADAPPEQPSQAGPAPSRQQSRAFWISYSGPKPYSPPRNPRPLRFPPKPRPPSPSPTPSPGPFPKAPGSGWNIPAGPATIWWGRGWAGAAPIPSMPYPASMPRFPASPASAASFGPPTAAATGSASSPGGDDAPQPVAGFQRHPPEGR